MFYLRPDLRRALTARQIEHVSRFSLLDRRSPSDAVMAVASDRVPGVSRVLDLQGAPRPAEGRFLDLATDGRSGPAPARHAATEPKTARCAVPPARGERSLVHLRGDRRCRACAIGHLRVLGRVALRLQSGRDRPDGEASDRRTRVSAVHVRPELYAGRRGVAGGANLSDRRRVGRGAETSGPRHQSGHCPSPGPGFRTRRRAAAGPCGIGGRVRRGAEPRDRREVSGSQRRHFRAGALCPSALGHPPPTALVRADLGLGFLHRPFTAYGLLGLLVLDGAHGTLFTRDSVRRMAWMLSVSAAVWLVVHLAYPYSSAVGPARPRHS